MCKVARFFGISVRSLYRYVRNAKNGSLHCVLSSTHKTVFSSAVEDVQVEYIQQACDIYFGLTPAELRCLAFSFGKELKLKLSSSWMENEKAGQDWFSRFLKRQPQLSIRKPEATSVARASGFNKHTVSMFFDNLNNVLKKM